jgi:hypothetical protein
LVHGILLQVSKADYPGCPGAQLLGWKHAGDDHSVGRRSAYFQNIRSLIKHHLAALGTFAFTIGRNAIGVSQTTDMGSCPCSAMPGQLARAVQDGGDRHVR